MIVVSDVTNFLAAPSSDKSISIHCILESDVVLAGGAISTKVISSNGHELFSIALARRWPRKPPPPVMMICIVGRYPLIVIRYPLVGKSL